VKFSPAILAFTVIASLFAQGTIMPKFDTTRPSAAPAPADPNKVILTIGDEKITEAQFNDLINSLPEQYREAARTMQKRQFAEQIVQVKLLAQEAEKKKLDQDPKTKETLLFQRQNLLAQAMFVELQKGVKVDDAAVEQYYNQHKSDYDVLKAKHILIRVKGAPMQARPGKPELTDDEALAKAQEIRKRLLAGGDFAAIAKADSDDLGSGAQGGELGEFHKGMMVPPFEAAAFAAKVNEVTEPVKTPFGYHLIVVESHAAKSLADARPDIEAKLKPQLARDEVENLRKGAAVTMDDSFFGATQPALGLPTANK
jgi:peptidyl-prolyl cis-trans isomerase C